MDPELKALFQDGDETDTASESVPAIQKLSHRHEAIMVFMVANPAMSLGDVAKHFNISQPWLSSVIWSDAFQAKFKQMREDYMGSALLGIVDKVELLAHMSLDKIIEELPHTKGVGPAQGVMNDTLKALGYGAPQAAGAIHVHGTGAVQVNQVNPAILDRANEKRLAAARKNGHATEETSGVQTGGESDEGSTGGLSSLSGEETLEGEVVREQESGDQI